MGIPEKELVLKKSLYYICKYSNIENVSFMII